MSPGRPKRAAREARVRAQLGLPPKQPGERAMNASELSMLKMRVERKQDERVEQLSKRGKHLKAFIATLPPLTALPLDFIGLVSCAIVVAFLLMIGVGMPWPMFGGIAVLMCFMALDGRPRKSWDDDEDFE